MSFILDTSVTMAWCFDSESTPVTDSLLDRVAAQGAVVPSIWPLEVANVLLVAERRSRLTQAQAARFGALLTQLPIEVTAEVDSLEALLSTGRHSGLSAYDASYLLLAEAQGLPLATLDRALSAAAGAAGVELLVAL